MEAKKSLLTRVTVPTRIIVHRSAMSTAAMVEMIQSGELTPTSGQTCELEVGGQVVARGRIVRRRGGYCFRVLETAGEERP